MLNYTEQIEKAVQISCDLLSLKSITDVQECIPFLQLAYQFKLENALFGIRKMLSLVWSGDTAIRDCLMKSFISTFFPQSEEEILPRTKELIDLCLACSLSESISFRELIKKLAGSKKLPAQIAEDTLWKFYSQYI